MKELNCKKSPLPSSWIHTSKTVTLKLQEALLPEVSVAAQLTVVIPSGKTEPDGGEQTTVAPGQLSTTVGAGYVTIVLTSPGFGVTNIWSFGQVTFGGSTSLTLMVCEQDAILPPESVAVHVIVVTPTG